MRYLIFAFSKILFSFLTFFILFSVPAIAKDAELKRPKLVVGIVVDQMRYDFLYRYWNKYGSDGFKRLLKDGYSFENTHYNYVPTYTGPGHASIYTGTTPADHGIVGNDWFVRKTGKMLYCTEDKAVKTVGSNTNRGEMSPVNMLTSTITDELRLATNSASKVIGICLKDRGSILPAGHMANAAYWYDGTAGNWISSTFYMNQLPQWVQQFNDKKVPQDYLSKPWNTLLPIAQYTQSSPDDNEFEKPFSGETRPVFPHNLSAIRGNSFDLLASTPFGNTLTKDFAIEALKQEKMGTGNATDFLALSFSSTDYVGHQFGPNSIEVEDTYLRLDKDIAEFLKFLDKAYGKKNVLVFLTADHGAAHSPGFLKSLKMPGGSLAPTAVKDSVQQFMKATYGEGDWISKYYNQQIYLNRQLIDAKKLKLGEVQQRIADYLQRFTVMVKFATSDKLQEHHYEGGLLGMIERGFMASRSGDIVLSYQPGWPEGYDGPMLKGTTHGSASRYDTHVPLIWYGWQVKKGSSAEEVYITDIAPTIAQWLKIQEPNACTGKPLQPLMK